MDKYVSQAESMNPLVILAIVEKPEDVAQNLAPSEKPEEESSSIADEVAESSSEETEAN